MHKPFLLSLAAAVVLLGSNRTALADPNGDRPGLTHPPELSLRTPASVPESGTSLWLLGAALTSLALLPLAHRRLTRAGRAGVGH